MRFLLVVLVLLLSSCVHRQASFNVPVSYGSLISWDRMRKPNYSKALFDYSVKVNGRSFSGKGVIDCKSSSLRVYGPFGRLLASALFTEEGVLLRGDASLRPLFESLDLPAIKKLLAGYLDLRAWKPAGLRGREADFVRDGERLHVVYPVRADIFGENFRVSILYRDGRAERLTVSSGGLTVEIKPLKFVEER